jgi:hypothetical protein
VVTAKITFTNAARFITEWAGFAVANVTLHRMFMAKYMFALFSMLGMLLAKRLLTNHTTFTTLVTTGFPTLSTLYHSRRQRMTDRALFQAIQTIGLIRHHLIKTRAHLLATFCAGHETVHTKALAARRTKCGVRAELLAARTPHRAIVANEFGRFSICADVIHA